MSNEYSEQERRQYSESSSDLMAYLTIEQKLAVKNLTNFGYQLAFIRKTDGKHGTAFLVCGSNKATVDMQGNIETDPKISIR